MTMEGRFERGSASAIAEVINPRWIMRNCGTPSDFIIQYGDLASRIVAKKLRGLREIAPSLLELISDEKSLHWAWTYMESKGSHAPGPDGFTYENLNPNDLWKWCRGMRDTIREGWYELGEERVQRISKGPGRGFRELVIQSVEDRVVQRAAVEILKPLLDPLFDPRSFGYRPGKGPLRALATAETLYREQGRGVWVSVDIRNAFPSVPLDRLLGVIRKYFPDDDLVAFMEVLTRPDKQPGLRQGSPLSPLLLNLYLHHILDRKWRQMCPDVPLLRFADDILLLCRTPKQAREAYALLASILQPAGFMLKEAAADAIRCLKVGQEVSWMGFGISVASNGLRYSINNSAWGNLAEAFADARFKPNWPLPAVASLVGWINDKGPCLPHTNLNLANRRIARHAASQGFDEVPDEAEITAVWKQSNARWCKMLNALAGNGVNSTAGATV